MIDAADHLGLVHLIANRYRWACCARLEYEDLVQLGTLGVLRAIEKFDPDRGFTFGSYAKWWIDHAVRRGIQNQRRLVAVPVHRQVQGEWLPSWVTVGITDKTSDGRAAVVLGSSPPPHLGEGRDIAEAFAAMPNERTQDVVWLRMHGEKLEDLGEDLGVSKQRAAKIEATGIAAARRKLSSPSARGRVGPSFPGLVLLCRCAVRPVMADLQKVRAHWLAQLDDVLSDYKNLDNTGGASGRLRPTNVDWARVELKGKAAVKRLAPGSLHDKECDELDVYDENSDGFSRLRGIVEALRHDIDKGYLESVSATIHGEVFSDFVEMAEHLLQEGYKDAAAVIAGSALEQHLREMGKKAGISIESNQRPKRADLLNADLVKASVYTKLEQKNVTAWLGLRNEAAHGNYSTYEKGLVEVMIMGVRDFIVRHPA